VARAAWAAWAAWITDILPARFKPEKPVRLSPGGFFV